MTATTSPNQIWVHIFSGTQAGNIFGFPLSGVISHQFGWKWIFYSISLAGCLWSCFYFWFCYASPQHDPGISEVIIKAKKFLGLQYKLSKHTILQTFRRNASTSRKILLNVDQLLQGARVCGHMSSLCTT